jgi:hypothetical protein
MDDEQGHSWPVNPLELALDELIGSKVSIPDSGALAGKSVDSSLISTMSLAEASEAHNLSPLESELLEEFEDGANADAIRRDFTDENAFIEAVSRLRDAGLLEQVGVERQGDSAPRRRPPGLTQDDNPETREVSDIESETGDPTAVRGRDFEPGALAPSKQTGPDHGAQDAYGETRESAPWDIDIPPEAIGGDDEESDVENAEPSDAEPTSSANAQEETRESGPSDVSLPSDAEEYFGDSRELDDLLKSVIEDSDAELEDRE